MLEQIRLRLAQLVSLEARFHDLIEPEKAIAESVKQIVITLSEAYATLHAQVGNIERQLALLSKPLMVVDTQTGSITPALPNAAVGSANGVAPVASGPVGANPPDAAPHTPAEAVAEGRVDSGATPGAARDPLEGAHVVILAGGDGAGAAIEADFDKGSAT